MAVYTRVSASDLAGFLRGYSLGEDAKLTEIAEGVENSNFLLDVNGTRLILTIFERRVEQADLPWFFSFMTHLRERGIACPSPLKGRDGSILQSIRGKPAVLTSFLEGRPAPHMTENVCHQAGRFLAQIHLAGQDYEAQRNNAFGPKAWVTLSQDILGIVASSYSEADAIDMQSLAVSLAEVVPEIAQAWPKQGALPSGPIHADFFPDNVFFMGDVPSGVIDFYFACTEAYAYDLAIAINAWCFHHDVADGKALCAATMAGYQSIRPLSVLEREAMPLLAKGAALRFTLTRLYDWLCTPKDALVARKDPRDFKRLYDLWTHEIQEVF